MRERWQIAAALSGEPDVLVLDEPTNHLDGRGVRRLAGALRRHRGLGVLVSHDRNLFDTLPDRVVRVTAGEVTSWRGTYSVAWGAWEEAERVAREESSARRGEGAARPRRAGRAATGASSSWPNRRSGTDEQLRG